MIKGVLKDDPLISTTNGLGYSGRIPAGLEKQFEELRRPIEFLELM
jgi:hypothetical protein